jgi:hypothetical protein
VSAFELSELPEVHAARNIAAPTMVTTNPLALVRFFIMVSLNHANFTYARDILTANFRWANAPKLASITSAS